jgi:hypothetical protein
MRTILSGLALLLFGTSAHAWVTCGCEHMGSQWDGICEVNASDFDGSETFSWDTFGAATMPYQNNPVSNFAYYSVNPLQYGGLIVTIHYPNRKLPAAGSLTMQCANGT